MICTAARQRKCRTSIGMGCSLLLPLLLWNIPFLCSGGLAAAEPTALEKSCRLPAGVPPEIGAWFWQTAEVQPEGYRQYIDMVAEHSPYGVLTTSQRVPREITEPAVHDQYKAAVAYARQRGLRVVLDLDLRLAREAFRKAHPDEMQEVVRIEEADLDEVAGAAITIGAVEYSDHMTWGSKAG